MHPQQLCS